jgi:hypothetical protein
MVCNVKSQRFPVAALAALTLAALASCGGPDDVLYPKPDEPLEADLYDLVTGPVNRASAFDVVAGRATGTPRAVRVDATAEWDVAFAVIDSVPVWLPRGFFAGFPPSAGVLELTSDFDSILTVPDDQVAFETEDPLPISVGTSYAIRSRQDPSLSVPCRIYAKVEVLSVEGDPARMHFRFLWNPNCDDRETVPGEGS